MSQTDTNGFEYFERPTPKIDIDKMLLSTASSFGILGFYAQKEQSGVPEVFAQDIPFDEFTESVRLDARILETTLDDIFSRPFINNKPDLEGLGDLRNHVSTLLEGNCLVIHLFEGSELKATVTVEFTGSEYKVLNCNFYFQLNGYYCSIENIGESTLLKISENAVKMQPLWSGILIEAIGSETRVYTRNFIPDVLVEDVRCNALEIVEIGNSELVKVIEYFTPFGNNLLTISIKIDEDGYAAIGIKKVLKTLPDYQDLEGNITDVPLYEQNIYKKRIPSLRIDVHSLPEYIQQGEVTFYSKVIFKDNRAQSILETSVEGMGGFEQLELRFIGGEVYEMTINGETFFQSDFKLYELPDGYLAIVDAKEEDFMELDESGDFVLRDEPLIDEDRESYRFKFRISPFGQIELLEDAKPYFPIQMGSETRLIGLN